MNKNTTQITGLTLIEKVLDFERKTHDKSEWTFEKQKDNPPRFIRLQQLNVLLKYFTPEIFDPINIALGLDNLIKGQFILRRETGIYNNLFNEMDTVLQTKYPSFPKEEWNLEYLQRHYTRIVLFKKNINTLLMFNSGILEASYVFLYSIVMIEEFAKKLDTTYIDNFLSLVIDPLGRIVSMDRLIQDYNYPTDDDVFNVDIEWL